MHRVQARISERVPLVTFCSPFPSGIAWIQGTETCCTERSPAVSAQSFRRSGAEYFLFFNYSRQESLGEKNQTALILCYLESSAKLPGNSLCVCLLPRMGRKENNPGLGGPKRRYHVAPASSQPPVSPHPGQEARLGGFSPLVSAKRFHQFLILCFKNAHKPLSKENQSNSLKIKIAL